MSAGIRKRAESLLANSDAVDIVERLLRNQVYLDEKSLRDEIEGLGFVVQPIGQEWGVGFTPTGTPAVIAFPRPGHELAYKLQTGETAREAVRKMAKLLRAKARDLEALVK